MGPFGKNIFRQSSGKNTDLIQIIQSGSETENTLNIPLKSIEGST